MVQTLADVQDDKETRIRVQDPALRGFFPRGLRRGIGVLVMGGAGAGKSTFIAQLTRWQDPDSVLWLTFDEACDAVQSRAQRFNGVESEIGVMSVKNKTVAAVIRLLAERSPAIVVVDGLSLGRPTDGQLATMLHEDAKGRYLLVLASGAPFGRKSFEHMFHTVVQVERHGVTFLKNRLGPVSP